MAYTGIPSNPFTVPGTAAGFLDIRKKGTTSPVITVSVPAYSGGAVKLATPTNTQAAATSQTALNVTASSVANASHYQLYLLSSQTGAYSKLGGLLTTPTYLHTGLMAGQTYTYKWQATGDTASNTTDSDLSPSFSGTTQANSSQPVQSFTATSFAKKAEIPYLGFLDHDYDYSNVETWGNGPAYLDNTDNQSTTAGTYSRAANPTGGYSPMLKGALPQGAFLKGPSFGMGVNVLSTYGAGGAAGDDSRIIWGIGSGGTATTPDYGIGAQWNSRDGQFRFVYWQNGTATAVRAFDIPVVPPFAQLAFAFSDRSLVLLYKKEVADPYTVVFKRLLTDFGIDPSVETYLQGLTYSFVQFAGANNPSGSLFTIGNVEYGYLKGVGQANFAPVKLGNGQYYNTQAWSLVGGSVAHFSAAQTSTSANPTGSSGDKAIGIHTANGAIFKRDAATSTHKQYAKLFVRYLCVDGVIRIKGHNSYAWICDSARQVWCVLVGNWGTNSEPGTTQQLYYYEAPTLPTEGSVYVFDLGTPWTVPSQPNPGSNSYANADGDLAFYDDGSGSGPLWHAIYNRPDGGDAFTLYHATSTSPNGDTTKPNNGWTVVATRPSGGRVQEGGKALFDGVNRYFLATDYLESEGNTGLPVYDRLLQQVARISYASISQATSPGHAAFELQPLADGNYQAYLTLFDGTQNPLDPTAYSWGVPNLLTGNGEIDGTNIPKLALPA